MDSLPVMILAFWILIGGFVGGFLQMMFASCDDNELSFKTAFWYAIRNSWTREEEMSYCPNCGARMDGD